MTRNGHCMKLTNRILPNKDMSCIKNTILSYGWFHLYWEEWDRMPGTIKVLLQSSAYNCMFTNNSKCRRKSALRMGVCTSAMMKIHEKERLWQVEAWVLSRPQALHKGPHPETRHKVFHDWLEEKLKTRVFREQYKQYICQHALNVGDPLPLCNCNDIHFSG